MPSWVQPESKAKEGDAVFIPSSGATNSPAQSAALANEKEGCVKPLPVVYTTVLSPDREKIVTDDSDTVSGVCLSSRNRDLYNAIAFRALLVQVFGFAVASSVGFLGFIDVLPDDFCYLGLICLPFYLSIILTSNRTLVKLTSKSFEAILILLFALILSVCLCFMVDFQPSKTIYIIGAIPFGFLATVFIDAWHPHLRRCMALLSLPFALTICIFLSVMMAYDYKILEAPFRNPAIEFGGSPEVRQAAAVAAANAGVNTQVRAEFDGGFSMSVKSMAQSALTSLIALLSRALLALLWNRQGCILVKFGCKLEFTREARRQE